MTKLNCSNRLIEQTLTFLKKSGLAGNEGIVLWLAQRTEGDDTIVVEVLEPPHRAAKDFFHISAEGMATVMRHLRETRTRLVAQVHSHPHRAFHSEADDTWAIARHEGALSLVVPNFAQTTSANTFLTDVAIFRLAPDDQWNQVAAREYDQHLVIS